MNVEQQAKHDEVMALALGKWATESSPKREVLAFLDGYHAAQLCAKPDSAEQVPVVRKATKEEILAWAERHCIYMSSDLDRESAFEDAASLHMTYAAPLNIAQQDDDMLHIPRWIAIDSNRIVDQKIATLQSQLSASQEENARLKTALTKISRPVDYACGCSFPCRCNCPEAEAINAQAHRDIAIQALEGK